MLDETIKDALEHLQKQATHQVRQTPESDQERKKRIVEQFRVL